jgi:Fic family protein
MDPKNYQNLNAGRSIQTARGFWAFVPAPLPPKIEWTPRLVQALADAEREISRMSTFVDSFPFPKLLIQPFIRSEAVLSSRIEGTRSSLVDLYNYEAQQLSFFEKTDDVREVHNYVSALDYGLERIKTLPISLRLIREIHAKLMENVRGGLLTPGDFRRSQNWIGPMGSTPDNAPYVPPPLDEMESSLYLLEEFVHQETQIPALVRAAMVHYQFEAIHPFLDGNGRIGRLLIILLFCEWGILPQPVLNLSSYIEHYRQEYYDLLLKVSQNGDWENWLIFFLRGVSEQARSGIWQMTRLQELRQKYQEVVETERNKERMAEIIDYLFSRPIFSVKQMAEELKIPYKTANDYIDKLWQKKILRESTGYGRNRVFYADEIFQLFK